MRIYRLYCINGVGKMTSVELIDAISDEEAIAIARNKKLTVHCELWEQSRLVGFISAQAQA